MEGSDEGAILAILTEKNDLVGTVRRVEGRLRFVPDDCPAITMPLARDCEGGAKDGDKVAVEILNRGNRQEDHRVGVAMRFGSSDEAKRCAKALLYAKDIRTRFPDKVRDEAKSSRAQRSLRRTARAAWTCAPCPSSPSTARDQGHRRRHQPDPHL